MLKHAKSRKKNKTTKTFLGVFQIDRTSITSVSSTMTKIILQANGNGCTVLVEREKLRLLWNSEQLLVMAEHTTSTGSCFITAGL